MEYPTPHELDVLVNDARERAMDRLDMFKRSAYQNMGVDYGHQDRIEALAEAAFHMQYAQMMMLQEINRRLAVANGTEKDIGILLDRTFDNVEAIEKRGK